MDGECRSHYRQFEWHQGCTDASLMNLGAGDNEERSETGDVDDG